MNDKAEGRAEVSTLKDVAARAGVSVGSVSTAINRTAAVSAAMRARVERAIAELGYVPHAPARTLKIGRSRTIGLVLPDLTNPHFSGLASAIETALDGAGFTLTLCSTTDDPAKEVRQLEVLRAQRVAGVIVVPGGSTLDSSRLAAHLRHLPSVLLDRTLPGLDLDSVLLDNAAAGRLATEHLLGLGHRRIAVVTGPTDLALSDARLAGCRAAAEAAGSALDGALIVDGGFQAEPSRRAMATLLGRWPRPTAVVASSNHTTVGVMMALRDARLRCPADVSVVGIDDFTWAEAFTPRLTAVAQPIRRLGEEAVRLLLRCCAAPDAAEKEAMVLAPELLVRDSTAPPAG